MLTLSRSLACLSMLALGAGAIALMPAAPATAGDPPKPTSYAGRWTVVGNADDPAVFSARGLPYRTIDMVRCGPDLCGISVSDAGRCGPTLFRFRRAYGRADELRGSGRWGAEVKNIVLFPFVDDVPEGGAASIQLYLGEGYNFGGRSGNMPKYHADYRRVGVARCMA